MGQTGPLCLLPCLLPLPPGQGPCVPGERAGRWAGEPQWCQSAAGCIRAVEPGVLAQEVDAEGGGAAVGVPEKGVSTGRVRPPAESDPPAPTPRGSVLHQRLFLSPVQEGSWNQLCR